MMTDGDGLEFVGRRDNLEQTLELGRLFDRGVKGLDCDVGDVIVRSDHSEVTALDEILIVVFVSLLDTVGLE